MPFYSKKQERLFQMVAHNKKRAKELGMSQEMAKKYIKDSENKETDYIKKLKEKLNLK